MGHVNGPIYEKSYRNQIVDADIVSAFPETPSDEAVMKLMGHMLPMSPFPWILSTIVSDLGHVF
jgi:hypothetical protein